MLTGVINSHNQRHRPRIATRIIQPLKELTGNNTGRYIQVQRTPSRSVIGFWELKRANAVRAARSRLARAPVTSKFGYSALELRNQRARSQISGAKPPPERKIVGAYWLENLGYLVLHPPD